eukprot:gene10534-biopygen8666
MPLRLPDPAAERRPAGSAPASLTIAAAAATSAFLLPACPPARLPACYLVPTYPSPPCISGSRCKGKRKEHNGRFSDSCDVNLSGSRFSD